jgi:hypothetical protein
MSVKLKEARSLRATTEPLTLEQVAKTAPAILSDSRGVNTLSKYETISTHEAINLMAAQGYVITFAAQQKITHPLMAKSAKHLVRMRHESMFSPTPKVGESVPEVCFVNAHDGSSKFHVYIGRYRFICTNGLMTGETVGSHSLRHTGKTLAQQVKEMLDDIATRTLPIMEAQVHAMRARQLSEKEQVVFASHAIALRWETGTDAVSTNMVLRARREEDAANDMWSVYNRVQENVMMGGFTAANRNRNVQALEQVNSVVRVNRAMWDMAVKLAA